MNKKVVIDAGHGGSDPGAVGNQIVEKDYTLLISNYIYKRLKDLGIDVSITRNDDITLNPSERVKKILSFYGNGKDVIVVSNHINAGGGSGAEIIYSIRNNDDLAKTISSELERSGQKVRKYYQRRLPSNPSRDYYYILRDTANNESVIVEYAFVDNVGSKIDVTYSSSSLFPRFSASKHLISTGSSGSNVIFNFVFMKSS